MGLFLGFFCSIFTLQPAQDLFLQGSKRRTKNKRGKKKKQGGKKEMASGTCRGRKNKEENFLFANSKGEHSHCGVMNKSFCSMYISHQLTFQRNCSTVITAPPCSVPCSSHGCVHPSPFPSLPSRIRCHMLVSRESPGLKPLPGH